MDQNDRLEKKEDFFQGKQLLNTKLLLLLFLLTVCSAGSGNSFLQNGNFDKGAKNWQLSKGTAVVRNKVLTLNKKIGAKSYPYAIQNFNLTKGKTYDFSFDYRAANVGCGGEIRIEFPNLKTGIITEIVNHNTVWHPKVITFTAQDDLVRLMVRIRSNAPVSKVEYRNLSLCSAGQLLPPLQNITHNSRKSWNYKIRGGRIQNIKNGCIWRVSKKTSELSVITPEIWPESDHQVTFTIKVNSLLKSVVRLDWYLEPLDLKYKSCGKPIHNKLLVGHKSKIIDKKFKFPILTVFVRMRWRISSDQAVKIELNNLSLLRLKKL